MHRALRIALSTIKWVAIVGCAGAVIVVLVNLRDEDLAPEAQALAEFHRPAVPDAQNAYLVMVGFDAPAGSDPISAGAKIVKENEVVARSDPTGATRAAKLGSATAAGPGDGRLPFVGDTAALCDPIDKPCLQPPFEDAEKIRAMAEANAELIARYLALQRMPAYANTSYPDLLQPIAPAGWNAAWRVLLAQAAIDARSGKDERALAFLAGDMAFWRRVLAEGSGLVDEMIAVRRLTSDLALLSEFFWLPSFDVHTHQALLRQMLTPLTPAERNAAKMFRREYEWASMLLAANHEEVTRSGDLDSLNRQLARLFYKKQASLNQSARLYGGLQALGSHPPADFAVLKGKLDGEARWMSEPGITWLYNPIGKTLVGIAIPAYSDFVARVFDLAAYVQLVRAQLEVQLAGLPSDKIPQFLDQAQAEARNPYTNQPFTWDATNRSLSFEPMNQHVWTGWKFIAAVPPPTSPS